MAPEIPAPSIKGVSRELPKIVLGKNARRKAFKQVLVVLKPPPVAQKFIKSPDGATGELV